MADSNFTPKEKAEGFFEPDNEDIKFTRVWGGHRFSDAEVKDLLAGKTIKFESVSGKLAHLEFNGYNYIGFKPDPKEKAEGVYAPTGETVSFAKTWSGHKFTDEEIETLLNGESITITAHSKAKDKDFETSGTLEQKELNGNQFWGFVPDFAK